MSDLKGLENIEAIGQLADRADNFAAAVKLPLPPKVHADQLAEGMREISRELKRIYVEVTGENPWDMP